jgi:hypothetical protein
MSASRTLTVGNRFIEPRHMMCAALRVWGRVVRGGIIAVALCGCGINIVELGIHRPGPVLEPAMSVTGVLMAPTGEGALVQAHLAAADPSPAAPYSIRHVKAGAGYRLNHPSGAVEFALEAGAGEPAHEDLNEIAVYGGGSVASAIRVCGRQDYEPGFAPIGVLFDVVTTFRGGVWTPAAGDRVRGELPEASLHVGLRVTAISDMLDLGGEHLER